MFCPQCKSEYIPSITRCHSCNVDLISELPVELDSKPEYFDYEEVLKTSDLQMVPILKSVLESAGITYYINGEETNRICIPTEPIRLMVSKDEAGKARELLDGFEQNFPNDSTETEEETDEGRPRTLQFSGKLKIFTIGLMIGILLAGFFSFVYVYNRRHYNGTFQQDVNKDGKSDSLWFYQNGMLSSMRGDRNFDGKTDEWCSYANDIIVRSQYDNDFNGIPDVTYYYVDGIVNTAEFHPNGSEIIVKKQFFENGVLTEEWLDTNQDGKFDEKIFFDFSENPIRSSFF